MGKSKIKKYIVVFFHFYFRISFHIIYSCFLPILRYILLAPHLFYFYLCIYRSHGEKMTFLKREYLNSQEGANANII